MYFTDRELWGAAHRVGENIFYHENDNGIDGEIVKCYRLLYSGTVVLKTGRTTRTTQGVVISIELIMLEGSELSHEITIMGIRERKVFVMVRLCQL